MRTSMGNHLGALAAVALGIAAASDAWSAVTVRFALPSSTVAESQGFQRLYVQVSPAPASLLFVQLLPQFGSGAGAAGVADFLGGGGPVGWLPTITIPAGQTAGYYDMPINNDTLDEFAETFTMTIAAHPNYTLDTPSAHVLTIAEDPADPAPRVGFVVANSTAIEGTQAHRVEVALSGPTGKGVTVNWSRAANSTATSPGDFTPASGSVTFVKDSLQTSTAILLNIAADGVAEAVETAVLNLTGPVNATLGTIATHTVSLFDASRIYWASAAVNVAENAGTAMVTLNITPPSPVAINVDISRNDCCDPTASAGQDHTFSSLNGFTLPANTANIGVPVPILNDTLDEWDENFQLVVKNPTSGSVVSPSTCTVTVVDNDPLPTVRFLFPTSRAYEKEFPGTPPDPSSATVLVELSAASGREIRVPWSVLPSSTAARPGDYDFAAGNPLGQPLVFPPGTTQFPLLIDPLVPDLEYEPDETIVLQLGTPVNATLGAVSQHTVIITDDDNVTWLLPESDKALGVSAGHRVRFRKAAPGVLIDFVHQAETLLGYPLPHAHVAFEVTDHGVSTINYVDAVTDAPPQGNAGGDRDIHAVTGPPTFAAGNVDDFAMESSGYLQLPQAGHWTFTVHSDDGFRLRLGQAETVVMEHVPGRAPASSHVTVHVPRPGLYRYRLTYFEAVGGAQVELLARGPSQLIGKLVGDPSGGISVFQSVNDPPVLDPEREPLTLGPAGHNVRFYKSAIYLDTLDNLLTLLNTYPAHVTAEATDHGVGFINYLDAGGDGVFTTANRAVATPPLTAASGIFNAAGDDDFGMVATGFIHIPQAGIWTFGVNSDDGFRLRMGRNLEIVSQYAAGRAPASTEARVCVLAAGYYRYELIYFQGIGGAEVEFYAFGPGQAFARLVGDLAGTLRVYRDATSATPAPVAVTPEWPEMIGANPGHRVRFRKAAPGVLLYSTDDGETLLNYPASHSAVAFDLADNGVSVINYVDGATDLPPQGVFPLDRDIHALAGAPRFAPGDVDDYAMRATGYLEIPTAGAWRFSVLSDDGFRLRMGTENTLVMELVPGRAPAESLAVVNIPRPGLYRYDLTFAELAGGSQIEFFARPPGGVDELVGTPGSSLRVFQDAAPPSCAELPGDWVAGWKAEGDARDVSGLFPGVLVGGTGFASGRTGQAFNLDGVDDYIQVGSASGLKVTGAKLTMAAWIHPTGAGSPTRGGVILSKEGEYFMVRRTDGTVEFAIANAHPGWTGWTTTGQPTGVSAPLNTWTHLALVYDGATAKLYANGALLHTRAGTGAIGDGVPAYNDLRIGNRQQPGFDSPFQGRIDEVAVFRRDLTAAEVQAVYAAGSGGWCPQPSLRIVRAPQPEVRWPHPSSGYVLQATDQPANAASWTAVNSVLWGQDAARQEWFYRDPAGQTPGAKKFFRLARP